MKKKIISMFAAMAFLFASTTTAAAADQTLFFSETDGKLHYDSPNQENLAVFLLNEKMTSGVTYDDTLAIENKTKDAYHVYFQMVPPSGQTEEAMTLLKKISIKLYLDGRVLYEGSADGLVKTEGADNYEDLTSIGTYEAGAKGTLYVEYQLMGSGEIIKDKAYFVKSEYEAWSNAGFPEVDRPISYNTQEEAAKAATANGSKAEIIYMENSTADDLNIGKAAEVTASSEWKFYAEKVENTDQPTNPEQPSNPEKPSNPEQVKPIKPGPATGDYQKTAGYIIVAGAVIVLLAYASKKKIKG